LAAVAFRCYPFESRWHDWYLLSLYRGPNPPFAWCSCVPRTIHPLLAASPCSRLSRPQSTISQSDFRQAIRSSLRCWLVGPYPAAAGNLTDLPCSHEIPRLHADGTNPGSTPEHSPMRILEFRLPHRGIRSATSTTFDFGAIFPFTFVSAYCLPVYASQWPLPDTTQDSVPDCWLGFVRAAISGCWIPCASRRNPHRTGHADFPHPALGQDTCLCTREVIRSSPDSSTGPCTPACTDRASCVQPPMPPPGRTLASRIAIRVLPSLQPVVPSAVPAHITGVS